MQHVRILFKNSGTADKHVISPSSDCTLLRNDLSHDHVLVSAPWTNPTSRSTLMSISLIVVVAAARSSSCSPGTHLQRQLDRQAPIKQPSIIASPPCQLQVAQTREGKKWTNRRNQQGTGTEGQMPTTATKRENYSLKDLSKPGVALFTQVGNQVARGHSKTSTRTVSICFSRSH